MAVPVNGVVPLSITVRVPQFLLPPSACVTLCSVRYVLLVQIAAGEISDTETAMTKTFAFCLDYDGEDSAPCTYIHHHTETDFDALVFDGLGFQSFLLTCLSCWLSSCATKGYGIVTSTESATHDELSWIVKLSGASRSRLFSRRHSGICATTQLHHSFTDCVRHRNFAHLIRRSPCIMCLTCTDVCLLWCVGTERPIGTVDRTGEKVEALRTGDVFDTEFIQCGKQYVGWSVGE